MTTLTAQAAGRRANACGLSVGQSVAVRDGGTSAAQELEKLRGGLREGSQFFGLYAKNGGRRLSTENGDNPKPAQGFLYCPERAISIFSVLALQSVNPLLVPEARFLPGPLVSRYHRTPSEVPGNCQRPSPRTLGYHLEILRVLRR